MTDFFEASKFLIKQLSSEMLNIVPKMKSAAFHPVT